MRANPSPRTIVGCAVASLALATTVALLGSMAIHVYGAHRLENTRFALDQRRDRLGGIPPAQPVADNDNGARWLSLGGHAIECSLEDQRFYGRIINTSVRRWTGAEKSRAGRILSEQQEALKLLLQTGSCSAFSFGHNGLGASRADIDSPSLLRGVRLLVLEARMAWDEGRTNDSLRAFNALGRSADGLLRTPKILSTLLGVATARWAAGAAAEVVQDPLTGEEVLEALRTSLPKEDPVSRGELALLSSIEDIADERMEYLRDHGFDPHVGWSVPFWVLNRYLLEDLVIARTLEGWDLYLELGLTPAAAWPASAGDTLSEKTDWPSWLALSGALTPNMLSNWFRLQGASSHIQLLRVAIEARLKLPTTTPSTACLWVNRTVPTALTGEPVACSFHEIRGVLVLEVRGAEDLLRQSLDSDSFSAKLPPIAVPVGTTFNQAGDETR